MAALPAADIRRAVRQGLEEDLSQGDVTTAALFTSPVPACAHIIAQQPLVVAGMAAAVQTFVAVDPSLTSQSCGKTDRGRRTERRSYALKETADPFSWPNGSRSISFNTSRVSRHSLNDFVRPYAAIVWPSSTRERRYPDWRALQKWAVSLGGGMNHRRSLGDGILIKDNHLLLLNQKEAVREASRTREEQGTRWDADNRRSGIT